MQVSLSSREIIIIFFMTLNTPIPRAFLHRSPAAPNGAIYFIASLGRSQTPLISLPGVHSIPDVRLSLRHAELNFRRCVIMEKNTGVVVLYSINERNPPMEKMNPSNHSLLKVENLRKYFPVRRGFFQRVIGYIKAVDGVDLEILQGKTLGLVGESGCGKSTIGRLILKLLEPDDGKIIYKDQEISGLSQ